MVKPRDQTKPQAILIIEQTQNNNSSNNNNNIKRKNQNYKDRMLSSKQIIYKEKLFKYNKEAETTNIDTDVTVIEEEAFHECLNLKAVITSSVTSIGAWAFYECIRIQ